MKVTFYTSPMLSHPLLWFYFRADLPNPSLWPRFSLTSHCHKRTAKWQLQFFPHISCCGPSFTCRAMTLRRKFSTITGYIQIFGDCQFESLVVNHSMDQVYLDSSQEAGTVFLFSNLLTGIRFTVKNSVCWLHCKRMKTKEYILPRRFDFFIPTSVDIVWVIAWCVLNLEWVLHSLLYTGVIFDRNCCGYKWETKQHKEMHRDRKLH